MSVLRQYIEDECGADGYPFAWHAEIKHLVRELAGNRCVRCLHPYTVGQHGARGEWSLCDEFCLHQGPVRNEFGIEVVVPAPIGACIKAGTVGLEARWRILTVHHLDGDKKNCRWWNLAALCQRCHLRIQTKVHLGQVYPFEHSEWFKPYAAGYYAVTYLGEDLTREETMSRMDELLALELVAVQ